MTGKAGENGDINKPTENGNSYTKRVAVIGAGFSGLTAAAELKRLGKLKFFKPLEKNWSWEFIS